MGHGVDKRKERKKKVQEKKRDKSVGNENNGGMLKNENIWQRFEIVAIEYFFLVHFL